MAVGVLLRYGVRAESDETALAVGVELSFVLAFPVAVPVPLGLVERIEEPVVAACLPSTAPGVEGEGGEDNAAVGSILVVREVGGWRRQGIIYECPIGVSQDIVEEGGVDGVIQDCRVEHRYVRSGFIKDWEQMREHILESRHSER